MTAPQAIDCCGRHAAYIALNGPRTTVLSFFAPGIGLVAMILRENITAFWIYNVNGAGPKVLVSIGGEH
jgi:hypothetical protein